MGVGEPRAPLAESREPAMELGGEPVQIIGTELIDRDQHDERRRRPLRHGRNRGADDKKKGEESANQVFHYANHTSNYRRGENYGGKLLVARYSSGFSGGGPCRVKLNDHIARPSTRT